MNYYPHHIGDYLRDTAHLTMIEDGAYRRLIDLYYQHEQPLPTDKKQVYRLSRASTPAERRAVDTILSEYFTQTPDGFRHTRCDQEIEEYQERSDDDEARKENEKERQRRHRERRKALFAALREHDVVPAWDTKTTELETLLSRYQQRPVTRDRGMSVTPPATAIPITKNQEPKDIGEAASTVVTELPVTGDDSPPPSPPSPDEAQARATQIAVLLRRGGACQRTTMPNNRTILTMAERGYPDVVILQALQTGLQRRKDAGSSQPVTAAYLLPIIEELQTGPPARAGGRYAEDIRQMREMSAWADQQILEQQGATRPPAELDMGAADAPRND